MAQYVFSLTEALYLANPMEELTRRLSLPCPQPEYEANR